MVKPTFKQAFLAYTKKKLKRCGNIYVTSFEEATGRQFQWEYVNSLKNMERLQDYFSEKIAPNSVRYYMSVLITFMTRYALENGLKMSYGIVEMKKVKAEKSQSTYLTEEDIAVFAKYEPQNDFEYYVHRLFFICLMTGCRLSDGKEITLDRIQNGKFSYVAQKTKSLSSGMDIGENVMQILRDKRYIKMQKIGCSLNTYNKYVKLIGEKVGLTEMITLYRAGKYETKRKCDFLSSHYARRSAATNMYKRDPNAILNISRMLGHSNTAQTENYIKCATEDTDGMRSYRTGFSLSGY